MGCVEVLLLKVYLIKLTTSAYSKFIPSKGFNCNSVANPMETCYQLLMYEPNLCKSLCILFAFLGLVSWPFASMYAKWGFSFFFFVFLVFLLSVACFVISD